MEAARAGAERLSLLGATLTSSLGKSRKQPPGYPAYVVSTPLSVTWMSAEGMSVAMIASDHLCSPMPCLRLQWATILQER